jgi:hypothetical protein
MRYRYSDIGQVWSAWSDPVTVTSPEISDGDTAEQQALTSFGPVSIPDGRISMNLLLEIARVGASGTYAADCALTDVDCHIQINQSGSVQLFRKYRDELLPYA